MLRVFISQLAAATALAVVASSTAGAQQYQPQTQMCEREDGALTEEFQRSVVITRAVDPQVFAGENFSLASTLKKILSTAVKVNETSGVPPETQIELASSEAEQIALLNSLIRSFRNLDRTNKGVVNNATFRPNEAALDAGDMLTTMQPVGLFNRLDLAPQSWRYCGEHRVVYAMGTGLNRLFLIFEAAVDNPDPAHRPEGCLRIAKFWDSMRAMPPADRGEALANFYYEGDLGDAGTPITPVLHNQHFGVPFGQVRGNLFLTGGDPDANPWMLREWRTFPSVESTTTFIPDTVKSNPNPEFYSDAAIATGPAEDGRTQAFLDLRPEFREEFLVSHVRELIEVDLEAALDGRAPTGDEIFNGLSALFDDRFNDFESVSQIAETDDPLELASAELRAKIEHELGKFALPGGWALDADHILARASALSCGGCHNLAEGKPIGPGGTADVNWPAAAKFVHITETGELSAALTDHFLPARCEGLQRYLEEHDDEAVMAAVPEAAENAEVSQARATFTEFQALESAAQMSEALPALAEEIEEDRREDAEAPGAFRRFRRTH